MAAFFSEFDTSRHVATHVPHGPLAGSELVGGYDWGYQTPACFVLARENAELGEITVVDGFCEAGLSAEGQAERVCKMIMSWGGTIEDVTVYADPCMFGQRSEGARQIGPELGQPFWALGIRLVKADNHRKRGWREIRRRLHDGNLAISSTCKHLISDIANARPSKSDPEDVEGETAPLAAARYLFASRAPELTTGKPEPADNRPWYLKRRKVY